ncbi:ribbon-helix-helix protein, CopG family [Euzebya sp.]|uniref:type II toxin-antitoxin system VapB family antitoxin n=1 Tax=Euzebya sp. TaxID=1971409 RepID=UPI003514C463
MSDVLIRDVPDEVVSTIDARAKRMGISRTEYLRRALIRDARVNAGAVSVDDLRAFSERHRDLDDPDIMRSAWS